MKSTKHRTSHAKRLERQARRTSAGRLSPAGDTQPEPTDQRRERLRAIREGR